MSILVTGATGFIGRHVAQALRLAGRQDVTVASRNGEDVAGYLGCVLDLNTQSPVDSVPERIIHLAWEGLPNYKEIFHVTRNMPRQLHWLEALMKAGVKDITVAGTCFEYGMREGCLSESLTPEPNNPYSLAKDTLRRALRILAKKYCVRLKWARLFYVYGPGQNPLSLIPQLEAAAARGDEKFPMSGGLQVRDYLPVEIAAQKLVGLALQDRAEDIYNICSGQGVRLLDFVQDLIEKRGYSIQLEPGYYPYPDWEPFRFWGDSRRIDNLLTEISF